MNACLLAAERAGESKARARPGLSEPPPSHDGAAGKDGQEAEPALPAGHRVGRAREREGPAEVLLPVVGDRLQQQAEEAGGPRERGGRELGRA